MRAYLTIIDTRFRLFLQYRMVAFAGFGTQLFWGLIRMMIFAGFYHSTTAKQPMTYEETVTYIWLGQAFLVMLLFGIDGDIAVMIRSGGVAYELLRPVDLYSFWFCRIAAARAASMMLRAIPMFLFAGLFFGLQPPPDFVSGMVAAVAILCAFILSCALTMLLTISLFWTISGQGIADIMPVVTYVFSGMIVPLPFFPDWSQPILDALPFRGMADVPFRIYAGHIPSDQALPVIAGQICWIFVLVILGRLVLTRGLRRLVLQGG